MFLFRIKNSWKKRSFVVIFALGPLSSYITDLSRRRAKSTFQIKKKFVIKTKKQQIQIENNWVNKSNNILTVCFYSKTKNCFYVVLFLLLCFTFIGGDCILNRITKATTNLTTMPIKYKVQLKLKVEFLLIRQIKIKRRWSLIF